MKVICKKSYFSSNVVGEFIKGNIYEIRRKDDKYIEIYCIINNEFSCTIFRLHNLEHSYISVFEDFYEYFEIVRNANLKNLLDNI